MKITIHVCLGMLFLLFACNKSEQVRPGEGEDVPFVKLSSISLTVLNCDGTVDPFCESAIPVIGTSMRVFPSLNALMLNDSIIGTCTTNQDGRCMINNLNLNTHYLVIRQPTGEEKTLTQETPPGTTSFLEVIFD